MIKNDFKILASDLFSLPHFGRGILCLWKRNFLYFKQTVFMAMAWIFLEPLLYLFALGYGLGRFVAEIDGMSYAQFIAPSMMATSGMFIGFFEGTYSTYTKLTRQNTYQTVIMTPISSDEVVLGEILWVTTKAALSVTTIGVVLAVMKLIAWGHLPSVLGVLFLMSWTFAALGVYLASIAKSYEWFSYFQSGLITPMSLFCGTYFPLEQLPDWLEKLAYLFPLTHGMAAVRMILSGQITSFFILHMLYLAVFGIVLTNIAAGKFQRKLVC